MLSRVLIANRGEIALRVIRACHEMGIETVAVYSEADRNASYLRLANESVCIGPPDCNQSYLNIPRIISAAEITNVDAIHPGYGFLAENANFAQICSDCGITFIGPPVEAMRLLGDKVEARKLARRAKVPVVPGSEGVIEDEKEALRLANEIGYPIIIKAVAGGGGRGMRVVHNDISLRAAMASAKAEAEAAFGEGSVYMEKFIVEPRHVEVQVMADREGNAVHFFERDCSIQRRHQKMIEESPCPVLEERQRERLAEAAIRLIKEARYVNAATVEFLLDKEGNFYFIEVNTRIQVEHPVSEMVTGQDLIKWQLRIAGGEPITLRQTDIKHHGVAIECRINAEDPSNNFSPSPGTISRYIAPGGLGVRIDTHVHQGWTITPNYDSLIAKIIVHQETRTEAIATMRRALQEFVIEPVKTTIPACLAILSHNLFVKGKTDTGFVERTF
ncbi:MAG: acetyl-CoA carboxylase biotin carboxylase subunit [Sedimentisphaerales bacterium]|jgi:acetyl-CoA carboxylase biotin carboxylase subunit|nr:acetyl-CoA carboxylase biotin carboxylase subunit [Sedimentisphaerales bacterium]HNY77713.1 acetyl-CoA carboxylase biotin carboxylase subunit [Sedimentisphaerales bacterium]HOC63457.1 acetyl-CoA carboxylase biotin carboxylase subunit [Sedimentisphaerales bacterium]HOH63888.1 acetyl-CoA carboxylase biotin carboxylase subunit [Sedimentisphaerales bacterium]HQA88793.1 acetyl-CoA carboxylase biotin carboxylase subunit [Sedimentisphaerales bacterium]